MKTQKKKLSDHRCAICNRRLYVDRWVYSRHTCVRYCPPGEGCSK